MKSQNRRQVLFSLAVCVISAATVVVGTAFADELLGVLTKIDTEGKKITVVEKDSDKEVIVTITDKTEQVYKKKGESISEPVDLTKLENRLKKAQDNGQKGITVKVYHEKGVASKIETKGRGKKAAAQ